MQGLGQCGLVFLGRIAEYWPREALFPCRTLSKLRGHRTKIWGHIRMFSCHTSMLCGLVLWPRNNDLYPQSIVSLPHNVDQSWFAFILWPRINVLRNNTVLCQYRAMFGGRKITTAQLGGATEHDSGDPQHFSVIAEQSFAATQECSIVTGQCSAILLSPLKTYKLSSLPPTLARLESRMFGWDCWAAKGRLGVCQMYKWGMPRGLSLSWLMQKWQWS